MIKETFSPEDTEFISNLIYPKKDDYFRVDDAFGIFIGYEISITASDKKLPNDECREKIKKAVLDEITGKIALIDKHIVNNDLSGHCFHIYILPFTDLNQNRKDILRKLMT